MKKWNHYTCGTCGKVTVARHDDEGVTPFLIGCYATKDCHGMSQSCFFDCDQSDDQQPHVIFYRPPLFDALDAIKKEPASARTWLLEHYSKGGALMRVAELEANRGKG